MHLTECPKHMRQKLIALKGGIDKPIIVGNFNIPLSIINGSGRQKNQYIVALENTINQLDLINIYRIYHSKTAEYIFSFSLHGTFSKINHILGHEPHLNKFLKNNTYAKCILQTTVELN